MRPIDADAYAAEMREKQDNCRVWKDSLDEGTELYARAEQSFVTFVEAALTLKSQPTIDVIPVDWMLQRMNETASGVGLNVELNNALFTVGVEWERWKKEHASEDVGEGGQQ